jgi:hypothetical protein
MDAVVPQDVRRVAAEVELNAESDSPDAPTEMTQPNKKSLPG